MRLAQPRFTIRRLMMLVAIVGVSLAGLMMGSRFTRRAQRFRQQVQLFQALERNTRRILDLQVQTIESHKYVRDMNIDIVQKMSQLEPWRGAAQYDQNIAQIEREARLARELVSHYSRLKQKYERAAFRPWERVAPDPPTPSASNSAGPVTPPSAVAPQAHEERRVQPNFTS